MWFRGCKKSDLDGLFGCDRPRRGLDLVNELAHEAARRAGIEYDEEKAKADAVKRIDERLERIEEALERFTCAKVARMDRILKDARSEDVCSEDVGQVASALGGMDLEAFERIMEAIGVEG